MCSSPHLEVEGLSTPRVRAPSDFMAARLFGGSFPSSVLIQADRFRLRLLLEGPLGNISVSLTRNKVNLGEFPFQFFSPLKQTPNYHPSLSKKISAPRAGRS